MTVPPASLTRGTASAVFCIRPLARLPRADEDTAVFFRCCLYAYILPLCCCSIDFLP